MPIAKLEFNLPEEKNDFVTASNADKLAGFIWEYEQRLRELYKHSETKPESWEAVREEYFKIKEEHNIPEEVWE